MTPLPWARWVVARTGVVRALRAGGTVLEPTCGDGAFVEAIVEAALADGMAPLETLQRLWAVDRDPGCLARTARRLHERWGVRAPADHLVEADILDWSPPMRFAAALGNPPWVTFSDLPALYKPFARARFVSLDLVGDPRRLLLGASRAELAAAVVQRVLADLLGPDACATFLVPLSLFSNDGANNRFRRFRTPSGPVALEVVHDLTAHDVFQGAAATRYGAVSFVRGRSTCWPVPLFVHGPTGERASFLAPAGDAEAPLAEVDASGALELPRIVVPPGSVPRQGVNTGGANAVYFVQRLGPAGADSAQVRDGTGATATVPARFLFPVATAAVFRGAATPERWVVLPYDRATGRPLDTLERSGLEEFLAPHRERLTKRRGSLLRAALARGQWWAMLGVGPYCFAPFKAIWEAYGRTHLDVRVLGGVEGQPWQANQALQAFLPFQDEAGALAVTRQLRQPCVQEWLGSHGSAGTMNWAQPGRIKRILVAETAEGHALDAAG